jgi:heme/copper-type cytochrome/quinol oxidase subunit 2
MMPDAALPPRPDTDAPWWQPGGVVEDEGTVAEAVGTDDEPPFWLGFVIGWAVGFVVAMAVLGVLTYFAVRLVTEGG